MRPLLPILSLGLVLALGAPAFAAEAPQTPRISVAGKGEVMAAPDVAYVDLGVTSSASTAREALATNSKSMAGLVATLKAAGIDARDIQTSGFSVNPQYFYPDKDASGNQPPPRITGYEVRNGVSVKVRKIDALGGLLDQVVTVGANTINGVSFAVDDPKPLFEEARKAAFADAESRARTYADSAGVGLGDVLAISESPEGGAPQPMMMMKAMAAAASPAVPVEAGQLAFDVDVAVQWAIKPAP